MNHGNLGKQCSSLQTAASLHAIYWRYLTGLPNAGALIPATLAYMAPTLSI